MEGLRSAGPANVPTVTEAQFAVLEEELGKGPSAHGFDDERRPEGRRPTTSPARRSVRLLLIEVGQRLSAGGCCPLAGGGLAGAAQGLVRIGHVVVAEVIDGAAVGRHPGVEGIEGACP